MYDQGQVSTSIFYQDINGVPVTKRTKYGGFPDLIKRDTSFTRNILQVEACSNDHIPTRNLRASTALPFGIDDKFQIEEPFRFSRKLLGQMNGLERSRFMIDEVPSTAPLAPYIQDSEYIYYYDREGKRISTAPYPNQSGYDAEFMRSLGFLQSYSDLAPDYASLIGGNQPLDALYQSVVPYYLAINGREQPDFGRGDNFNMVQTLIMNKDLLNTPLLNVARVNNLLDTLVNEVRRAQFITRTTAYFVYRLLPTTFIAQPPAGVNLSQINVLKTLLPPWFKRKRPQQPAGGANAPPKGGGPPGGPSGGNGGDKPAPGDNAPPDAPPDENGGGGGGGGGGNDNPPPDAPPEDDDEPGPPPGPGPDQPTIPPPSYPKPKAEPVSPSAPAEPVSPPPPYESLMSLLEKLYTELGGLDEFKTEEDIIHQGIIPLLRRLNAPDVDKQIAYMKRWRLNAGEIEKLITWVRKLRFEDEKRQAVVDYIDGPQEDEEAPDEDAADVEDDKNNDDEVEQEVSPSPPGYADVVSPADDDIADELSDIFGGEQAYPLSEMAMNVGRQAARIIAESAGPMLGRGLRAVAELIAANPTYAAATIYALMEHANEWGLTNAMMRTLFQYFLGDVSLAQVVAALSIAALAPLVPAMAYLDEEKESATGEEESKEEIFNGFPENGNLPQGDLQPRSLRDLPQGPRSSRPPPPPLESIEDPIPSSCGAAGGKRADGTWCHRITGGGRCWQHRE